MRNNHINQFSCQNTIDFDLAYRQIHLEHFTKKNQTHLKKQNGQQLGLDSSRVMSAAIKGKSRRLLRTSSIKMLMVPRVEDWRKRFRAGLGIVLHPSQLYPFLDLFLDFIVYHSSMYLHSQCFFIFPALKKEKEKGLICRKIMLLEKIVF